MSRRATTTHRSDAHDATKDLLKSGAERIRGRHRADPQTAVDARHVPAAAPRQRARKPRPTTPKM